MDSCSSKINKESYFILLILLTQYLTVYTGGGFLWALEFIWIRKPCCKLQIMMSGQI